MNRRQMLLTSLKLSATASLLHLKPVKAIALETGLLVETTGNPLRFPPVFTGGTITLAETNVTIWPGTTTRVIGMNGSYPGPTIKVRRGTTFSATVVNQLTENATAHWHGLVASEAAARP